MEETQMFTEIEIKKITELTKQIMHDWQIKVALERDLVTIGKPGFWPLTLSKNEKGQLIFNRHAARLTNIDALHLAHLEGKIASLV